MKRLFSILYLYACVFSPSASALEITYSNLNPFSGSIAIGEGLLLRGEIVPGDYEYLLEVIRRDQDRFWRSTGFVLASPGGDIQEALKIARLIKGTYSTVFVGKATGPCVSACFFIFSAATRREASTRTLGIHRPYIHPRRLLSMSAHEAETLQRNALWQARSYLEDQDVPTSLIDKMFQQASTEIYWLSRDEIQEQLGRRPPWYEQFLIARCGLNKSLERKYFSAYDETIIDQLVAVDSCGVRLSNPEARAFLRSELKSPTRQ
jgi:hypothetical protein